MLKTKAIEDYNYSRLKVQNRNQLHSQEFVFPQFHSLTVHSE